MVCFWYIIVITPHKGDNKDNNNNKELNLAEPHLSVCRGLSLFPFVLAHQAILGNLPSPILIACPNHLNCAQ